MRDRRFRTGQTVRLANMVGLTPSAAGTYRIVALMPERGDSPQYRLRSDETKQERMETEDNLEPCDDAGVRNDNDN